MKKFTIFFLMVFIYLGNQARCEELTASVNGERGSYFTSAACSNTHSSMNAVGMLAYNYTNHSRGVYGVKGIHATKNVLLRRAAMLMSA